MAKRTTKAAEDNTGKYNYADGEIERARVDLLLWAERRARQLAANESSASVQPYAPELWDMDGRAFRESNRSGWLTKVELSKNMRSLKCAAESLACDLERAEHDMSAGLFPLLDQHETFARQICRSIRRARRCLRLLLENTDLLELGIGGLLILNATKPQRSAPRSERGRLVRRALNLKHRSFGWWPSEPKDEDLAALGFLTFVAFGDFEGDFAKRDQYAREATRKTAGGIDRKTESHLRGLIHHEAKRCRSARPK